MCGISPTSCQVKTVLCGILCMGHQWGMMNYQSSLKFINRFFSNTSNRLSSALLDDICRFLNLPRHAVKVAGILFKAGDPQPHPFRMRPLR